MKASDTEKTISVILVIFLFIAAVAIIILLLRGGLHQLPGIQVYEPPVGDNFMRRQEEMPPPVDKTLKEEFTPVYIMVNMDRMRERMQSATGKMTTAGPPISWKDYLAFGESKYLGGFVCTASIGVSSIVNIPVVDEHLGGGLDRPIMGIQSSADIPEFMMSLQGGKFEEFKSGLRSIAEGRMPEALNECMVSEDLASIAGLSVGDKLTLSTFVQDTNRNRKDMEYELLIVGIYQDSTKEYTSGANRNAYTNRRNEILTTFETVGAAIPPEYSGAKLAATYYLIDRNFREDFAKEVYEKGLDLVYDVVYADN